MAQRRQTLGGYENISLKMQSGNVGFSYAPLDAENNNDDTVKTDGGGAMYYPGGRAVLGNISNQYNVPGSSMKPSLSHAASFEPKQRKSLQYATTSGSLLGGGNDHTNENLTAENFPVASNATHQQQQLPQKNQQVRFGGTNAAKRPEVRKMVTVHRGRNSSFGGENDHSRSAKKPSRNSVIGDDYQVFFFFKTKKKKKTNIYSNIQNPTISPRHKPTQ